MKAFGRLVKARAVRTRLRNRTESVAQAKLQRASGSVAQAKLQGANCQLRKRYSVVLPQFGIGALRRRGVAGLVGLAKAALTAPRPLQIRPERP